MTVFEVLETIEALRFEEGFVDGESVSTANVFIFSPEDDCRGTDKDDENSVNCIKQGSPTGGPPRCLVRPAEGISIQI